MSNLRIITENFSDAGTLTGDPAFVLTPSLDSTLDNLKQESKGKIARTNIINYLPTYNQEIGIQFPNLKTLSAIVLGRHNFNIDMGIRFILYNEIDFDDTTGEVLYDSGDLVISSEEAANDRIAWGSFLWGAIPWGGGSLSEEIAPSSNYVHWISGIGAVGDELVETGTLDFLIETATGASLIETGGVEGGEDYSSIGSVLSMKIFLKLADGLQADIGRLIIGNYIQPKYNLNYKHKIEWTETSKQYRTEAATLRSDITLPVRKLDFSLDTIHIDDRTLLLEGFRYVGLRKDFYINLFPESSSISKEKDYSGIMKIIKVPVMSEYAPNIYKSKYVMEEI